MASPTLAIAANKEIVSKVFEFVDTATSSEMHDLIREQFSELEDEGGGYQVIGGRFFGRGVSATTVVAWVPERVEYLLSPRYQQGRVSELALAAQR